MTTTDSAALREHNKQVLHRAMAAIGALDEGFISAELHESLEFELPFEPAVPDTDRAGFLEVLSMMFAMFEKFDVTITEIYDLADPDMLVAQYSSDARGRDKPVTYQNEYIGVFRFRDGRITLWREYANPEVSHAALAKFADDPQQENREGARP